MCAPLRIPNLIPEAIDQSIAKVDYHADGVLIGTATAAPYSYWANVPVGNYELSAIATDGFGIATTSAAVAVSAIANVPPMVSLTSPANGTTMKVPGSFTLTADAASTTSAIAKVDFYAIDNATNASTLIGTATQAPYTANWSNVPLGGYTLSAVATDTLGAVTTSSQVSVTVNTGVAQAYYIHADHLDTPRVITDTTGNIVWQWDNTDPFGANMANENPNGVGRFVFNLRFPGQYFDKETNLNYNVNRDYDPAIGRYIQSDPIGLRGGINTYGYVENNPLSYTDPEGTYLVGLAGAGIGALIGGGASIAAQLIQNKGNLDCVNWSNVGWSALTGGAAGFFLTTPVGASFTGITSIGAGTNVLNYVLSTSPQEYSAVGVGAAAASGAAGGLLGGKLPNPYLFIKPSPNLNDLGLVSKMVAPKALGTNTLGGITSSYDYPKGAPQSCGCAK